MEKGQLFYKAQASGNDFIIIPEESSFCEKEGWQKFVRDICRRKWKIGADGVLVVDRKKNKNGEWQVRIFNADGSEAEMCGNGIKCCALWINWQQQTEEEILKIRTKAGLIETKVVSFKIERQDCQARVRVKMINPFDIKLNLSLKKLPAELKVNYVNTGVPHAVVFVKNVEKINVKILGEKIRFAEEFSPAGTNVDFVEVLNNNFLKVRTYERGVESETLSCGTGVVASSIIASYQHFATDKSCPKKNDFSVLTKSGEILKVYFEKYNGKIIKNVWLEGEAYLVYKGYLIGS